MRHTTKHHPYTAFEAEDESSYTPPKEPQAEVVRAVYWFVGAAVAPGSTMRGWRAYMSGGRVVRSRERTAACGFSGGVRERLRLVLCVLGRFLEA